jgi:hypothetical protein
LRYKSEKLEAEMKEKEMRHLATAAERPSQAFEELEGKTQEAV